MRSGAGLETVLHQLSRVFLRDTFAAIAAITLIVFAILLASGGDWRRYFTRNYRTDWLYTIFYASGFYVAFVLRPLVSRLDHFVDIYTPAVRLHVAAVLPYPLQLVVGLLAMDFCAYWGHRFQHANRWLWIFHSIHHSQEKVTTVTNFRLHFVDMTYRNCVTFFPAMIVGLPAHDWLPFRIAMMWIEQASHGEVGWTYGWLGRIFVSPNYHFVHHSRLPEQEHRNYSMILTIWDILFGTANWNSSRQSPTGVGDWQIPESFLVQTWYPFVILWRQLRALRPSAVRSPTAYKPPA